MADEKGKEEFKKTETSEMIIEMTSQSPELQFPMSRLQKKFFRPNQGRDSSL